MQLEKLQQQWQLLDRKIDQSIALQAELVRRVVVQPARRRVNRSMVWPSIDIAGCLGVLGLGVMFMTGHWQDVRLAAPAVVVMASVLALLIDSILQLQRVTSLDWTGPVAAIQASLERLRAAKIRQFKWVILLAPLVGFCGFIAGLHWVLEWASNGQFSLIDKINQPWVMANYAFGVLFALLGHLVARWLARHCAHHPWWKAVLDDISGKSLKTSAADVERWAECQQIATGH